MSILSAVGSNSFVTLTVSSWKFPHLGTEYIIGMDDAIANDGEVANIFIVRNLPEV